jgi:Glycosyl transferase family 2
VKLIGLMPVRNEAWCLGFTLRIALKWCDEVIVCDHGSVDTSRMIMEQLGEETKRVIVREDREDEWREMEQRQMLLVECRHRHATHIAIIDADEFLTGNLLHVIRHYMPSRGQLVELPGYNMRNPNNAGPWWYHTSGVWGNRWFASAFHDSPALHWSGDRFHHREPMGVGWRRWRPVKQGEGGTLHLWGASERRLRAKHALYRITERLRWPHKPVDEIEKLYSLATTPREPWTFAPVPGAWIEPYADLMQYLDIDAEPWQEAEVRSLLSTHGREWFAGLNLLGY